MLEFGDSYLKVLQNSAAEVTDATLRLQTVFQTCRFTYPHIPSTGIFP
jgi:hypothetical protein